MDLIHLEGAQRLNQKGSDAMDSIRQEEANETQGNMET